ncbi:MAG: hypothetical protein WCJ29_05335 [bacterium]
MAICYSERQDGSRRIITTKFFGLFRMMYFIGIISFFVYPMLGLLVIPRIYWIIETWNVRRTIREAIKVGCISVSGSAWSDYTYTVDESK